jgi:hypothetical protein
MRFWRRSQRAGRPGPDPVSDRQRLEQLLYRLADDIAADDIAANRDSISYDWAGEVRKCAEWVSAGSPTGLTRFFQLFDTDPRNTIHEQRFTRTRTYRETARLASKLREEHDCEMRRAAAEAASELLPWVPGSTGKALVYKDGTVVATQDRGGGLPYLADIKNAFRPSEGPEATLFIRPSGSCAVYDSTVDAAWLAARLHEHDPQLRLEQKPLGPGHPT